MGEVEKDRFITLPGKGGPWVRGAGGGSHLEKLCVPVPEDLMKGFIAMVQGWDL